MRPCFKRKEPVVVTAVEQKCFFPGAGGLQTMFLRALQVEELWTSPWRKTASILNELFVEYTR